MSRTRHLLGGAALLLTAAFGGVAAAGSTPSTSPSSAPGTTAYSASIVRDDAGVPHITAGDWGSLGFGQGWALSEDRACTLLDQIVKVRGERAKWFGPGEHAANINSDFAYRHLGLWDDAPTRWADQSARVQDIVAGYVAGFNAEIAANGLAGWCAGEDWAATTVTTQDLYAYVSDILLLASSRNFIQEIGSAVPPAPAGAATSTPAESTAEVATTAAGFAASGLAQAFGASNGWALGADRSTTAGGLLLANPHFPWEGELRFWETHLTIPGELNVYGVALSGLPGVQIGFNEAVAWTHTVSAGHRFTLYRYDLTPDDPTVYLVDGQPEAMVPDDLTIEVRNDDGSTSELTRTLYSTKHGPVVSVGPLTWTSDQAFAIGDVNLQISRVFEQFLGMDTATSMDEFQAVHDKVQGIPWVNTIATSADGRAWYADTAATPNLSPGALAAWTQESQAGGLTELAYDQAGVILLDGSDSQFDWVDDPAAPAPGLLPSGDMPELERSDYVFNANDSHWLANPEQLLTGYSILQGGEGIAQSPRTRTNVMLLGESNAKWDVHDVEATLFSDRSVVAELLRQPLVDACTATPSIDLNGTTVDLTAACAALAGWDGRYTRDAAGAIVFREWLSRYSWQDLTDAGKLFGDGFDPTDPAGTPSVPVTDRSDWLVQLGSAVQLLDLVGIPVDAPLGDWQFELRSGTEIPLHGGLDFPDGVADVVTCCADPATLGPLPDEGELLNDTSQLRSVPGHTAAYPVSYGASFVMAIQFMPDGPQAEAILTYGNPDDPAAPAYTAGLEAFSTGTWRPLLFTPEAVAATGIAPTIVTG